MNLQLRGVLVLSHSRLIITRSITLIFIIAGVQGSSSGAPEAAQPSKKCVIELHFCRILKLL